MPFSFDELIKLLRDKEAQINAQARTIPLPPPGRLKFPKNTMSSTLYWVGDVDDCKPDVVIGGDK